MVPRQTFRPASVETDTLIQDESKLIKPVLNQQRWDGPGELGTKGTLTWLLKGRSPG